MMQFIAMGGYAMYVWPAYAVFFTMLAWDWFAPTLRRRRFTRELRGRLAREHNRNARAPRAEAST
ncbi:MAG TPA: heme exporter protein CcmD [Rhodanobacteraceae bacterium]|nr:heme exporter protein CcmD [Rhodanobacteraceae bacterium]